MRPKQRTGGAGAPRPPAQLEAALERIDEEFPADQNPGFAAERSSAADPLQNVRYGSVSAGRALL